MPRPTSSSARSTPSSSRSPSDGEHAWSRSARAPSARSRPRPARTDCSRSRDAGRRRSSRSRWTTCPLLLVAEGIERPGNLGTLVRSACSSGATGAARLRRAHRRLPSRRRSRLGRHALPPPGRRVHEQRRRSMAAREQACASSSRRRRPSVGAGTPGSYGPVAVVVGSERHGVSAGWRDVADELVSIPMPGASDSLNVAVAAGIVLFEAVRQRMRPVSDLVGHLLSPLEQVSD